MIESHICLKTIYELRTLGSDQTVCYHVPAYQRGYRWTPTQVTQLLNDIREFTKRPNPRPEEFYCLQPLVLRTNDDGSFEVVDGQQRLTTLLLIQRYFNERLAVRFQQKLYRLEYATRSPLEDFLADPSAALAASNIDFFHIDRAVKAIEEWFEDKENEVRSIEDAFLNRTKVIWYQLAPTENAIAAFTRLNVGKIALTNGELIRALFLKGEQDPKAKLHHRIAHEWDMVEKTLQSGDFWCFLSNDTDRRGGRIDFLFELDAQRDGMQPDDHEYATFNHFSRKFAAAERTCEAQWQAVKQIFMTLEEWFEDARLYHMVGYLIWAGVQVNELLSMADGATKRSFKEALRLRVFQETFAEMPPSSPTAEWIAEQIDELDYRRHSSRIRRILLLFNLATLLQNEQSNIRFQFEGFKTAMWDIEHVRSVASDRPGARKGQQDWLQQCLNYLIHANAAPELQAEIRAFLGLQHKDATDSAFDVVYEQVLRHFHESDEDEADHGISNLVLLDYRTNRSYKNAVFAVKRHRVLSLDKHGVFVPLCTRNVFLKCYSSQVDHVIFWTQKDRDGYQAAIVDTLHGFIAGGWLHE